MWACMHVSQHKPLMTRRHLFSLYSSWPSIRLSNSNEHPKTCPQQSTKDLFPFCEFGHKENIRKRKKRPAIPSWGPREERRQLLMSSELLVTHPLGNGCYQQFPSNKVPSGSVRAIGRNVSMVILPTFECRTQILLQ